MKLGSLFDGSGGFPLAGILCGIEPTWAAEVEPYPIAVTRSRFPNMKHLGSVTDINGAEIEPVDVITFGSPCQDLSVAGKRAGLKHEANGDDETTRSGLFMEAVRIIKEMRDATNGSYPTFALWENVPGAFSSNHGEDFRTVLEELIRIVEPNAVMPPVPKAGWPYADSYRGDGWSIAYRVFDAQHWGVPQRRRRIHLVLDLRGERAGKVLFEREGLRGYYSEGRSPWQGTACDPKGSTEADDRTGEAGRGLVSVIIEPSIAKYPIRPTCIMDSIGGQAERGWEGDVAPCLKASHYKFPPVITQAAGFKAGNGAKANGIGWQEETAPTLSSAPSGTNQAPTVCIKTYDARGNGDGETVSTITGDHNNRITDYSSVVIDPRPVYCLQGNGIDRADTAGCNGKGWKEDTSYTLNTIDRPAVAYATDVGFFNTQEEVSPTLLARGYKDPHLVTYWDGTQTVGTLTANNAGGNQRMPDKENFNCIIEKSKVRYIVRRLTPTECARLQGFADKWGHPDAKDSFTEKEYLFWLNVRNTHAAINGKAVKDYTEAQMLKWYNSLHTDSAEYKMWGNGIALPPALYCMQGIAEALERS